MSVEKKLIRALKGAKTEVFHQLLEELGERRGEVSLAGETFAEVQLFGFDLKGLDLSNTEWENCILEKIAADGANLEGAYFNTSSLLSCRFVDTNLEGAAFDGCVGKRCLTQRANVEGSEYSDCQFTDCTFAELVLEDVDWTSLIFNGGELRDVECRSGTVSGWTLRGVMIRNVSIADVEVGRCTITNPPEAAQVPDGFTIRRGRRTRV